MQPSFHFPNTRVNDRGDSLQTEALVTEAVEESNVFQNLVIPGCFLAIAGETSDGFFIVEAVTEVIFSRFWIEN